jgi:hypothetical protein
MCHVLTHDTGASQNENVLAWAAWQTRRSTAHSTIDWQFTTRDARTKLKRLYPTLAA